MKKYILFILFTISSFILKAQNNHIVKTDDGRRVLLKADFTWEYIDRVAPQKKDSLPVKETLKIEEKTTPKTNNCDLKLGFQEPKLSRQIQSYLKKGRATISSLKKKVAKKYKCDVNDIVLISANETKLLGSYTLCANGTRVSYKRNRFTFIKKNKLF